MLWNITIFPKTNQPDLDARRIAAELEDLGFDDLSVRTARVFLLEADLERENVERIARELLADPVIEDYRVAGGPDAPASGSRSDTRLVGSLQAARRPARPLVPSAPRRASRLGHPAFDNTGVVSGIEL